jgi:hypothetical protein
MIQRIDYGPPTSFPFFTLRELCAVDVASVQYKEVNNDELTSLNNS